MAIHEVDVYVLIDTAGDYVISKDEEGLTEAWENDIGGIPIGSRVLKAVLQVEMPEATELAISVPAKEGKASMTVTV